MIWVWSPVSHFIMWHVKIKDLKLHMHWWLIHCKKNSNMTTLFRLTGTNSATQMSFQTPPPSNSGPPNLEMQPLRTIRNTPQPLRACLNLSCSCCWNDLDSNLESTSNFIFFVNISEISLNHMSESTTLPFRTSEMLLTNWISKYPKLQLKGRIKKSQAYLGASLGNFFFQKFAFLFAKCTIVIVVDVCPYALLKILDVHCQVELLEGISNIHISHVLRCPSTGNGTFRNRLKSWHPIGTWEFQSFRIREWSAGCQTWKWWTDIMLGFVVLRQFFKNKKHSFACHVFPPVKKLEIASLNWHGCTAPSSAFKKWCE